MKRRTARQISCFMDSRFFGTNATIADVHDTGFASASAL
jgi:hypothetical protein